MALNPNIILAGQPVDVVGAMDAANVAGQRARQFQDANALNGFMRERGADVLRNDAGAVNALAQMGTRGLEMAQGVQGNALDMQAARLGMDATRQSMALARDTVGYIATGERAAELGLDPQGAYNITSGPEGMKATAIGGGGTNVTVNNGPSNPMPGLSKLGEGMTYQYNPDGTVKMDENGTPIAVPIEGTDRAEERATADRASQQARLNYDRKFNIVGTKLNQAIAQLEQGGRWVAGRGSLLSGIPETDARDFQATIDTIKANLGFEELQAMRDSSPTGGALGQVTEREIAFLQAIQGNLDTAQSPEQLMSVLMELKQGREQFKRERDAILGQQDTQLSDDDLLRMYGGD